ncbi:hypothetical protein J2X03_003791 [Microbacterium trichothecenolyticum]|uniref:phage portal protein n=1 Tax=Microbacterium trichothecenolyticum TaxID=69370 RepID=UPI00286168D1|nr:phage portal protein [Microbacterium trichothecenolyticum]MDR7113889.1 hypothetical protein [Microbacterium trichothecenolyticum]
MAWTDSLLRFLTWGGGVEARSADTWSDAYPSPTRVSESTATHLAPVFATFRHIVDFASTLPTHFYQDIGKDQSERIAWPQLANNVDAEYGWGTWIGQLAYALASRGNGVGEKKLVDSFGRPTLIEWSGSWSGGDDSPFWVGGRPLPGKLVAHVPWMVPPGKRLGLSPIEHYAQIVKAGLSAQEYADVARGGGIPPAHLKNTAKTLDADQSAAVQSRAVRSFATGKPFVSGNDWDLTIMTIPPNQAQFIETLKLTANQIAAIYGIDPREIGGSAAESLTYTNDESRALNRAHNLRPYLTRIERAVSKWLPPGQYMRFNVDATIRADIRTRTDVVGAQIQDGRLSVNEARALEERPPVTGGDYHNVPAPKAEPTQRTGDTP